MPDDSTGDGRTFIVMGRNKEMVRALEIRLEDYSLAGTTVHHSN